MLILFYPWQDKALDTVDTGADMSEKSVNTVIKKQEKKIVENLIKRTHFSGQEIERLLTLYRATVARLNILNIFDCDTFIVSSF